ncbi:PDC sensor domain-containing protein [Cohnella faecalis]|uniref:Uncharacterized protein n=1 Tax=Cohnella faecalis TaxID=2315694 RepID=A0A398CIH1_9BACL|nr:hypothetical protein [Cohnella faecalis]RIE03086.1 hypothetical protein D3H35_21120 [Cohnella faecalis]
MQTVQFGEGSSSYIVSQDGGIVYGPTMEAGHKIFVRAAGESRTATIKENDQEMLSTARTMDTSDWTLLGNIPVSSLVKDAKAISNLTWLMSLLAGL